MEFEITQEKENPLFNRKEIQLSLEAQITPSKNEVIQSIVEKFSTQPENININGIHGKFGSNNFIINANIYSSKEDKEKTEPKSKKSSDKAKTGEIK
jgi:ribosomal protein S24E